ncbi:hypothetical protein MMC25_005178 [Agyrium rufum]|nr:hypothetical protein [Agyrium rufum]
MPQTDYDQSLQALLKGMAHYTIQNLTINSYGPLTILSDKPNMHGNPQDAVTTSQSNRTKGNDTVTPQWSWKTADIKLANNLEGSLKRVTVFHKRGDTETAKTWANLDPGSTTDSFRTDFQSGAFSDYDYWRVEIQVEDGGPIFKNDGWKQCNLRDEDKESDGPNVFLLQGETFFINLRSGGDTTSFRVGTPGLNGFAWLQVENRFSVAASDIAVRHTHSGFRQRDKIWDGPIKQGESTSSWPVYFRTGVTSNDMWNISVMRDGDKKPHVNHTKDKGCWLQSDDNGRVVKIIVRSDGWTTAFPSGGCDDYWDWSPSAVPAFDKALKAGHETKGVLKDVKRVEDDWTSM